MDEKDVFHWIVYYAYGNTYNYEILNRNERSFELDLKNAKDISLNKIAITAVDRTGNESAVQQTAIKSNVSMK
jgi:crotonobetainyl-CoA:carnitine CoA-transferase CaiB-like acyl-CoA transferase